MKTIVSFVLFFALLPVGVGWTGWAAEQRRTPDQEETHYIQVIRGSDRPTPPAPGVKLAGLKIRRQLEPRFKWATYWEMQRSTVGVPRGGLHKVKLVGGYSLVIDLRTAGKRTVQLFRDQQLLRTVVCNRDREFCIQGVEGGDGTAWFFVVRTDPPAT